MALLEVGKMQNSLYVQARLYQICSCSNSSASSSIHFSSSAPFSLSLSVSPGVVMGGAGGAAASVTC